MIVPMPGAADQYRNSVNTLSGLVPIPSAFRPLTAGAIALVDFTLPPEPDPVAQPDVHAFWTELFSPPLTFVSGPLAYDPNLAPRRPRPVFRRLPARARQQSSNNWSGASLLARDGRMFTNVMAKFQVPNVVAPVGKDPAAEYRNSCWIGLDGQRFYGDATLPQIGIEQAINRDGVAASPDCIAWFQWWPMHALFIPRAVLRVDPGDTVYCWLTAVSYTQVAAIIKVVNLADPRGDLMRIVANTPPIRFEFPPTVDYTPKISGATAEWVTEAPTSIISEQIFPLPIYGQVRFDHCYALSALQPGDPYRLEPLIGQTIMNVFEIVDGVRSTTSQSVPPRLLPGPNTVVTQN